MAFARRFEDLRAWQAARDLTTDVYALLRGPAFARDFALVDQLRRAAISTMNNVAEGFDSGSLTEFARFLRYAARSASEAQSCLHVARAQRYVTAQQFDRVYAQAASVRRLCMALIRSLSRPRTSRPSVVREPSAPYGPCPLRPDDLPVTGHRSPVTRL